MVSTPAAAAASETLKALDSNPTVSGNPHYRALKQAFQAGDKAAAAQAFKGLIPVIKKGGTAPATLQDMQRALQTAGAVKPAASFASVERHLGGVALRAVPDWDVSLGSLRGMMYDSKQQQLVLVGGDDRHIIDLRMEDLAAAFACVFGVVKGNRRLVGTPTFSLDPFDETKPDGPWQRAVYMPDFLARTRMGILMHTADFLLKQYSLGVREETLGLIPYGTPQRLPGHGVELWENGIQRMFRQRMYKAPLPEFLSIPDIDKASTGKRNAVRNRLWIVVKKPMRIEFHKGTALIGPVTMGVEARRQEIGPDGRLRDVLAKSQQDPAAIQFAKQMTRRYDELEEPAFAALKSMAKAVAVALWVKKRGGTSDSLDLSWVPQFLNQRRSGVVAVTRLGFSETSTTVEHKPIKNGVQVITKKSTYTIHGGVDGTVKLKSVSRRQVAGLEKSIRASLKRFPDAPVFPVAYQGQTLQGTLVPISTASAHQWRYRNIVKHGGLTYRVGPEGKVTASTDTADGAERRYTWEGETLTGVRTRFYDGSTIEGGLPDSARQIRMAVTSSSGVRFDLEWNADFSMSRVRRNGKPYLVIREQSVRSKRQPALHRLVTTTHVPSGVTRKTGFDRNDRLVSEEQIDTKTGRRVSPSLRIHRNGHGEIESFVIPERGRATIARDKRQRVQTVSVGNEQIRLAYDDPNYPDLPTHIIREGKSIAEFRYARGMLKAVVLTLSPQGRVEAEFDDGRALKVRDISGFQQTFNYDRNGRLKQLSDSEGGTITWGADGRLSGATLHGGIRIVPYYNESRRDELSTIVFYGPKTRK